jgi:hypothetical protein
VLGGAGTPEHLLPGAVCAPGSPALRRSRLGVCASLRVSRGGALGTRWVPRLAFLAPLRCARLFPTAPSRRALAGPVPARRAPPGAARPLRCSSSSRPRSLGGAPASRASPPLAPPVPPPGGPFACAGRSASARVRRPAPARGNPPRNRSVARDPGLKFRGARWKKGGREEDTVRPGNAFCVPIPSRLGSRYGGFPPARY